ncbi:hypothetical protein QAD02_020191 [Eretmocerus hayati]|uniref:Uncharacterized protein n=1 Tax=Eretmocerus hayati TaxID=131215 RepID=A0ACC2PLD6_9HYME|nr:hypothetical protein QAD02_020191 [Eretmocerus hayati]
MIVFSENNGCRTSTGEPGDCINLMLCSEFLFILEHSSDSSPSRFELIRLNHCGFDGNDPKVCCPRRNQQDSQDQKPTSLFRLRPPKLAENQDKSDSLLKTLNLDESKKRGHGNANRMINENEEHRIRLEDRIFENETGTEFFQTTGDPPKVGQFSSADCGIDQSNRIYGGTIAEIDEFPWMAILEFNTPDGVRLGCAGLLIGPQYVLTAAHCIRDGLIIPPSWRLRSVRLGEYNLRTDPDCIPEGLEGLRCAPPALSYGIEFAVAHERFRPSDQNQRNDVALIKLAVPAVLNAYVRPICLPKNSELRHRLYVAGWGRTGITSSFQHDGGPGAAGSGGRSSSAVQLVKLTVPLIDKQRCDRAYAVKGIFLGPSQICAGGERGKDTCTGDSGGPLMQRDSSTARWHAVGIVSFGPTLCGSSDWPGVYTKLHDYLPWLIEKLRLSSA